MSNQISFNSDLANMLFNTAADPTREVFETDLVERFMKLAETATSKDLFRFAPRIDGYVISKLSGRNLLAVAKQIEFRAPAAIENMPILRKRRAIAAHTSELAQILSPATLSQFIMALRVGDQTSKG